MNKKDRLFIFFALLCNFLICADYAAIRPVSNALFITNFGSDWLPFAWLVAIPFNMLIIGWYNKYLPRFGCLKTFLIIASSVVGFNLFSALWIQKLFWLPFAFYVWKEIYILLMFQQLWSVINSNTVYTRAKWLYGIFFGIGACGAVIGSLLPGFFAVRYGSENLLFVTLPIYVLLTGFYCCVIKCAAGQMRIEDEKKRSAMNAFFHGFALIRSSRLLSFILLIVLCMQLSSTLIDFQFNQFLQHHILDKDLRTEYTGRILGIVHSATLVLQFIGSFLLVHFLGMRRSHFLIPLALALNNFTFLFLPTFGLITFSYISVKCFDFSLFGIIKEMMYIPLKSDEKFRAKAFIDIFAYRSSKALAAFLIFGLQWIGSSYLQQTIALCGLLIFVFWCLLVKKMLRSEPVTQGVG